MNIEQTASGIIKRFGKHKGIEFIQFVLSPEFGLQKRTTKLFWKEVLDILNEH